MYMCMYEVHVRALVRRSLPTSVLPTFFPIVSFSLLRLSAIDQGLLTDLSFRTPFAAARTLIPSFTQVRWSQGKVPAMYRPRPFCARAFLFSNSIIESSSLNDFTRPQL